MIKIDALTVQFGGIKALDALDAEFAAPIVGAATGVAMDGAGTAADGAASGSTCAAVCSDGWPGARRYQHLRLFAQSMW